MRFTKMHGTGNDYIFIDCTKEGVDCPEELAVRLCNRRYSIGADGMILVCPSDKADFRMGMYNADGSVGKMCGNGIRCFAKYVYEKGMASEPLIRIETLSGIKSCEMSEELVRVDMGVPMFDKDIVPVVSGKKEVVNEPVTIDGMRYNITCLSMGNPHCVVFFDEIEHLDLELLGPKFERAEMFPDRINTEFVQMVSKDSFRMREWERGAGETFSCGTGACAAFAAAKRIGLTHENKMSVYLKGGKLDIEWNNDNESVIMTGGAEFVFEGEIAEV